MADEKSPLFEYDRIIRSKYGVFCGVDEAGRGPLAGAVYAAAVILPPDIVIEGINDSKKLSDKKREKLFEIIKEKSVAFCIASADVDEIEDMNILNAAMLAMKRAVKGLSVTPDMVLADGNKCPDTGIKTISAVHGDALSASIAAASILAKVERDRYMVKMSEKFPQYGFEKHKGYGTKLHYEMIKKYGICEIHRPSFLKKLNYDK